eukprot:CAMPEP_0175088912 /NCGR_PEP_ID=MMETSP0086_2-20121207/503_1 /TAXON_ID=136419 /ORGANISM="Unknown Unknown, Strain D1" /LENGTH=79 /DNA_ID=CAMNT_0016361381 /DNA_START=352 /DNA_END=591 /DNA_ORIENTATION=+
MDIDSNAPACQVCCCAWLKEDHVFEKDVADEADVEAGNVQHHQGGKKPAGQVYPGQPGYTAGSSHNLASNGAPAGVSMR